MKIKYIYKTIFFIFMFFVLSSNVYAQKNASVFIEEQINYTLPKWIAKPLDFVVLKIENFRQDSLLKAENIKKQIKENVKISDIASDLEIFIKNDGVQQTGSDAGKIPEKRLASFKDNEFFSSNRPIEYIKLFFISSLVFILENKLIFYTFVVLLVLRLLRLLFSVILHKKED